jgi:hypothetical protein
LVLPSSVFNLERAFSFIKDFSKKFALDGVGVLQGVKTRSDTKKDLLSDQGTDS